MWEKYSKKKVKTDKKSKRNMLSKDEDEETEEDYENEEFKDDEGWVQVGDDDVDEDGFASIQ
jgi:hypothetical protein